ncbi:hypothetical protein OHA98_39915 [Streptomyces sp. NBC_00654]|uniref:hypothetical protein n=1 Tax=Streptomyces sp. NBC_00654 TaxID=2975799 RepID=UPI00225244A5|nr:hypothetical protein [Streptomyces sp. NBC_00654]MCX4970810.1 hypothetical protein [Streptomyces sp. NBC_00654]
MNGILTRPARTTRTGPAQTGPCDGSIVPSLAPRAGWLEDEEQRDTDLGPMPDETETRHHQLVHRLVADGDHRAHIAGRRTRRTLGEMDPGHERQPILHLTRPLTFRSSDEMRAADEPCLFCGRWLCPGCSGAAPTPAMAHTHAA